MKTNRKIQIICGVSVTAAAIGLYACQNGTNASEGGNDGGGTATAPLIINYTVDNRAINGSSSLNIIRDSGWHLLTLTANNSTVPVAIQSINYRFNLNGSWTAINGTGPASLSVVIDPSVNTCATATFQNQGDSCSVRFRINYNPAQYTLIPFNSSLYFFPGNASSPNISPSQVWPAFSVAPNPGLAVADIRSVSPIESNYWQGSAIQASPNNYQIILIQSGSPYESVPVNINGISLLKNPNYFSLMNRSSASESDPYYGSYPQCAQISNAGSYQVNSLAGLNSSCLLIYQAKQVGTSTAESDNVSIQMESNVTVFPVLANFNFYSSYESSAPAIQSQTTNGSQMHIASGTGTVSGTGITMTSAGSLFESFTTPNNFYQVTVTNYIKPANIIPTTTYEYGSVIHTPYSQAVPANGTPLLIAQSNGLAQQNSIVSSAPVTPNGTVLYQGNLVTVTTSQQNALNGTVNLSAVEYNGAVNLNTNGTVTLIDSPGGFYDNNCSGAAFTAYSSSCSNGSCNMKVQTSTTSYAPYSGEGYYGECVVYSSNSANPSITFAQPSSDNLVNLSVGLPVETSYIGVGGQTIGVGIGSLWGGVSPTYTVSGTPSNGVFAMAATYTNGQSTNNGNFTLGLKNGDELLYSTVSFVPSTEWNLASFTSDYAGNSALKRKGF